MSTGNKKCSTSAEVCSKLFIGLAHCSPMPILCKGCGCSKIHLLRLKEVFSGAGFCVRQVGCESAWSELTVQIVYGR